MFNENSGLVRVWVSEINKGNQSIENIPNISNLKEVVLSLLDDEKAE